MSSPINVGKASNIYLHSPYINLTNAVTSDDTTGFWSLALNMHEEKGLNHGQKWLRTSENVKIRKKIDSDKLKGLVKKNF